MSIKFGTDGWRAVIAEDFTFANVARVAQATADYWRANPVSGTEQKVIVGYDRRFLSDAFAARAAEVFAGNDFAVVLTPEPTPTPSVSFAVKAQRTIGGVMITASHNPPTFNGFKLKSHYGGSSDSETCQAVERWLDKNPVRAVKLADGLKSKRIVIKDVRPAHYAALKKLVDFKLIAKSKLRFAHEALFGVGAGCFEQLLAGTTCKVTTLNGESRSALRRHQSRTRRGQLRPQSGVSQKASARPLPGDGWRRRPRWRHGRSRQLSHDAHSDLPACCAIFLLIADSRAHGQGADHDFDGGQDVRGLRH